MNLTLKNNPPYFFGGIPRAIPSATNFPPWLMQVVDYQVKTAFLEGASYSNALKEALAMEEMILKLYHVAAEQSKHLMADVPRSFTLVSKMRSERIPKLKAFLDQAK